MNKLDIRDNEGSSSDLSCKEKLPQSCDFKLSPSIFFVLRLGAHLAPPSFKNQLYFSYLITTSPSPQKLLGFPFPSAHTSAERNPAAQVLRHGAKHTSELQAQFWQTFPNDLHEKELLDWPISSILTSI